jgi:hypothetical protein
LNIINKIYYIVSNNKTDKTDHHDIAEILLKVALNTITPNNHLFK